MQLNFLSLYCFSLEKYPKTLVLFCSHYVWIVDSHRSAYNYFLVAVHVFIVLFSEDNYDVLKRYFFLFVSFFYSCYIAYIFFYIAGHVLKRLTDHADSHVAKLSTQIVKRWKTHFTEKLDRPMIEVRSDRLTESVRTSGRKHLAIALQLLVSSYIYFIIGCPVSAYLTQRGGCCIRKRTCMPGHVCNVNKHTKGVGQKCSHFCSHY